MSNTETERARIWVKLKITLIPTLKCLCERVHNPWTLEVVQEPKEKLSVRVSPSVLFSLLILHTVTLLSPLREWIFMNGREIIIFIPITFILQLLQAPSGHSAAHVAAADAKSSPRTFVGKVSANVTELYLTKACVFSITWPSNLEPVGKADTWILNGALGSFGFKKDLNASNTHSWNFAHIIILGNSGNGLAGIINIWE